MERADMGAAPGGPGATAAAAWGPAGAYSVAGVGPKRPRVGVPAAAARCMRPESLPMKMVQRARQAEASGRVRRPVRSTASGRAWRRGAAMAASAGPGPAKMMGVAPGSGPVRRAWKRVAKRSPGQALPGQLAVGPRPIKMPGGRRVLALARSSGAVQAVGRGGLASLRAVARWASLGPSRRPPRRMARRRVGMR